MILYLGMAVLPQYCCVIICVRVCQKLSLQDNFPKAGVKGPPLKIALSNSENISAKSIELVANSFGIAGIYYGSISEASQSAITHLDSVSTITMESTKSAIIGTSSEIGMHLTLSDSLNSLWNTIQIGRASCRE